MSTLYDAFGGCNGRARLRSDTVELADLPKDIKQRDGHFFCKRCGIHTHATGESPRSGKFVAVVVACLDDVPAEELIAAPVRYLDGRNDIWDAAPQETRHL